MASGLPRRESFRSAAVKRKRTKVEMNLNMKYYKTILIFFFIVFIKISILLKWAQI